ATSTIETITFRYDGPQQWWETAASEGPWLTRRHIPARRLAAARTEAIALAGKLCEPDGSLLRRARMAFLTAHRAEERGSDERAQPCEGHAPARPSDCWSGGGPPRPGRPGTGTAELAGAVASDRPDHHPDDGGDGLRRPAGRCRGSQRRHLRALRAARGARPADHGPGTGDGRRARPHSRLHRGWAARRWPGNPAAAGRGDRRLDARGQRPDARNRPRLPCSNPDRRRCRQCQD